MFLFFCAALKNCWILWTSSWFFFVSSILRLFSRTQTGTLARGRCVTSPCFRFSTSYPLVFEKNNLRPPLFFLVSSSFQIFLSQAFLVVGTSHCASIGVGVQIFTSNSRKISSVPFSQSLAKCHFIKKLAKQITWRFTKQFSGEKDWEQGRISCFTSESPSLFPKTKPFFRLFVVVSNVFFGSLSSNFVFFSFYLFCFSSALFIIWLVLFTLFLSLIIFDPLCSLISLPLSLSFFLTMQSISVPYFSDFFPSSFLFFFPLLCLDKWVRFR